MNWKDSYNDICTDLRILQIHEMELRKRVELAHEVMVSGEIPSSGSYCHVPLDKAIEMYNREVDELNRLQGSVDRVSGVKVQMEQAMQGYDSLDRIVTRKRLVEQKTYREIADELGYSEGHLRSTISRNRNKHATHSANVS